MTEGQRVTAVTGWTDLRIGDPADDFAWLVASNEQEFVAAVLAAYTGSRRDTPDKHLLRRAALSAEFALAQYLVKGIAAGDTSMISEAESMLATLAGDIVEHGGQPISVEPLPAPAAPATVPAAPGPAAAAPQTADSAAAAVAPSIIAPVVPPVTVVPVPVPAVHVAPIPVEPVEPATKGPEDTSTAAISIIDVKKG